ncbi:CPBP family intramembrane metalloprotease [Anoxybacillus ayderensis]|uniref:CPBP family intramembrane metalloprotease n=1 Tax=Anoxybacillus flavithermus TaxID=33934 RepID=A0A2G5RMA8_9BACL|nr:MULTISPECIES: type II CAAX endopeptidase family protein [Anoxybacillus]MBW9219776.1 CPBP family intramembrane metalloprotease [Anoxybacillus sp. ST70]THD14577.1 CPBP family intramembrane metalloprotease [Anoxybacillus ayderensis]EMI09319.1 metal-dependent membrane protease [Anoxybacillus gonensis]KFZ42572.1 abortive infection protein [Anoxybacillus sp. KU2-6(11)]MCQ5366022.1 CPBP family intramembrane metalloprotease [Anoxybacillus gonensis]
MKKQYWYVIITYIAMQLSSLIGVPLLAHSGFVDASNKEVALSIASGYWAVISFSIAFLFVLYFMREDMKYSYDRHQASIGTSIFWGIGGFFLALFAQGIAANIEMHVFGVEMGSENTRRIVEMVKLTPALMLVTSIVGPILEEIIFRKIIFGTLYQKYNFFLSATVSSLLFAVVHLEFEHLLLYATMGFVFAFLYVKTKRILVPIAAHVLMNTFVVAIQTLFAEEIEKIMKEAEQMQFVIWRLFS